MKRVKLISENPVLNGKEALCTKPNPEGVYFIDGIKHVLKGTLYDVQEGDPSIIDVTFVAYQEMPDTFPIRSLTERVLYYCFDHKIQTGTSNIERRFRQLRDERGKINYEYDNKIHAYRKLPVLEKAFQEQIKY